METNNNEEKKNLKDRILGEANENIQVVWLEGQAPKQHNPQPVEIEGVLSSVSEFLRQREDTYDIKKSHCLVSKTRGTMELVINEQSVVNNYNIKGSIKKGIIFEKLGINTATGYEPNELSAKLRLMRSIFANKSEHMELVSTLRNLKAKVNQDLEQDNDNRGNVSVKFKQVLNSNIPKSFTLCLPLIEGENPINVEVETILEAKGTDIVCYLESVDAQELLDEAISKLIDEEVEKIKEKTAVIFIN